MAKNYIQFIFNVRDFYIWKDYDIEEDDDFLDVEVIYDPVTKIISRRSCERIGDTIKLYDFILVNKQDDAYEYIQYLLKPYLRQDKLNDLGI